MMAKAILGGVAVVHLNLTNTFKATLKTLNVVNEKFPGVHDGHNKANAFRHAFWNVIIANECYRFSSNIDKVLGWTKTITDWHEEFSPNKKMPR